MAEPASAKAPFKISRLAELMTASAASVNYSYKSRIEKSLGGPNPGPFTSSLWRRASDRSPSQPELATRIVGQ